MTGVMSGGLIYEYIQEVSNYGLVILNDNGTCSIRVDYDNLQKQYNKLDIKALESSNATATSLAPPRCAASLISDSSFTTSFAIPNIPKGGQDLIDNGIKNPNNGKLIQINNDDVTSIVYGSNGQELKNLAIKPLPNDQSNVPGENTSGTSGAPKPSESKKGVASLHKEVKLWVVGLVAVVGAVCLL
jgi:1,3-beta-glucanosyltransferase GAS3